MIARLDEAKKSKSPILLRTSTSAGHGIGTVLSQRIKQLADTYSFLFAQFDMPAAAKRSLDCSVNNRLCPLFTSLFFLAGRLPSDGPAVAPRYARDQVFKVRVIFPVLDPQLQIIAEEC